MKPGHCAKCGRYCYCSSEQRKFFNDEYERKKAESERVYQEAIKRDDSIVELVKIISNSSAIDLEDSFEVQMLARAIVDAGWQKSTVSTKKGA